MTAQTIERPSLRLLHHPAWLQAAGFSTPALFRELAATTAWEQPHLWIHGRRHPVPRLVAWQADPGCAYRYSGHDHQPSPWCPVATQLRLALEAHLATSLNSVLLNRYRDGGDRMGWHADDEAVLDPAAPVVSLSLGASRDLRVRPRPGDPTAAGQAPFNLALADGDLLVMLPPSQQHWQHALPQRRRCGGERLNLTFRRLRRPQPASAAIASISTRAPFGSAAT